MEIPITGDNSGININIRQGRSQKWAMEGVLTLKYTARCQKCLFIDMFKIWVQGF